MTRRDGPLPLKPATMQGFAIIGPVSPWDARYADEIRLDNAKSTFGQTAGEAWSKQIREDGAGFDPTERSRRVQHWHDRGYRLVTATLTINAPHSAGARRAHDAGSTKGDARMSDLVERLRDAADNSYVCGEWNAAPDDLDEAAARIETLEAAIIAALRARDEDRGDILRKALHGGGE